MRVVGLLVSSAFRSRISSALLTLLFPRATLRAAANLPFYQEFKKKMATHLNGEHIPIFRVSRGSGGRDGKATKLTDKNKTNKQLKQKHSPYMFGSLTPSIFTHCISYFPAAMIK